MNKIQQLVGKKLVLINECVCVCGQILTAKCIQFFLRTLTKKKVLLSLNLNFKLQKVLNIEGLFLDRR